MKYSKNLDPQTQLFGIARIESNQHLLEGVTLSAGYLIHQNFKDVEIRLAGLGRVT